ncbi:hypothetical protein C8R45DRAFT_926498 [Mycena sanguinolenta]|nr:hypothetical protein C8R45DRAFT_926498 [Mycena sanguinolenta]
MQRRAVEKAAALRAVRKAELDQLLAESEKVRSQKEREMEKWWRQEACIAQLSQQLASSVSLTAEEEDEVDSFRPLLVDSFRQPSPSSRRAKRSGCGAAKYWRGWAVQCCGRCNDTSDGESELSESSDEPEEKRGREEETSRREQGQCEETKKNVNVASGGKSLLDSEGRQLRVPRLQEGQHQVLRSHRRRPVKRAAGNAPRPRKAKAKGKTGSEVGGGTRSSEKRAEGFLATQSSDCRWRWYQAEEEEGCESEEDEEVGGGKEENAPEGPEEIANLEVIPEDGDDGGELADAINEPRRGSDGY